MEPKLTIAALQQMKRDGRKIVGVVAWDYPMAQIADRAGVDLISVGDSVGVNLWGHATDTEVTVDEMLICCKAVCRGAKRALVSCDVPHGPVQAGTEAAVGAAVRLAKEGGANIVKVLGDPGMVKSFPSRSWWKRPSDCKTPALRFSTSDTRAPWPVWPLRARFPFR